MQNSIEEDKIEKKTTYSNLEEILKEKLENAFHKNTSQVILNEIAKIAIEHNPIDLAYASQTLPLDARPILFDNLPNSDSKIQFLINTSADTRLILFRYMQEKDMKKIFDKMPTDEAVWVLDDMSERRFKRVLELLNPKKAKEIVEQKNHVRNSAGRLMTTEFLVFNNETTIKEASDFIYDHPKVDFAKGIFVVDENEKLIGYVPARNMIVNQLDCSLKQIMKEITHKVYASTSREEVVELFERYKLSSLAVVDDNDNIIGMISQEDVLEAMEDLADHALAKISGTAENVSVSESIFKRFLKRAPWLVVTLFAGLINVAIMSSFQKNFSSAHSVILTFILFFVPLITGMSGNIGIQCSTVLVRGIALGVISKKTKFDVILKELLTGLFTGVVFGIACGIIVSFLKYFITLNIIIHSPALGLIVSLGLTGACFAGTFLGVLSPIFFEKIGIDPAVASGPIVTAFNDVMSMSIYFIISHSISLLFF